MVKAPNYDFPCTTITFHLSVRLWALPEKMWCVSAWQGMRYATDTGWLINYGFKVNCFERQNYKKQNTIVSDQKSNFAFWKT